MRIIRFGALAILGLVAGFTLSSGGIQTSQDGLTTTTSSAVSFGVPDAFAQRNRGGARRTGRRSGRRTARRTTNRHNYYGGHRTGRRTARRVARRYSALPASCAWRAPYHYCGGIYYQPVIEDNVTVYVIVTP